MPRLRIALKNTPNFKIVSNEDLDFVKAKLRKRHDHLIEITIIMYFKIFLRIVSLLYKTFLKIKTSSFRNLIRETLRLLLTDKITSIIYK